MFELTQEEFKNWRSQFVTSKADKMGLRYPPYAFPENGKFQGVFEVIRALMAPPTKPKRKIGFDLKDKQAGYGKEISRRGGNG
jgi:hypothetical protein